MNNQPEFVSYKNKIVDFGIRSGTFTPDGEKESINYKQLVLKIVSDGDTEEVVLSGKTPPKLGLLIAALKGASEAGTTGDFLNDN